VPVKDGGEQLPRSLPELAVTLHALNRGFFYAERNLREQSKQAKKEAKKRATKLFKLR